MVKDVLLFQWPDHRPVPPPAGGAYDNRQSQGSSRSRQKGDGKGKPKDRPRHDNPRKVYATEKAEGPEQDDADHRQDDGDEANEHDSDEYHDPNQEDDQANYDEEADDDQQNDDEGDDDLSNEISQILTVTAKKLSSVVQVRKFGNPPAAKKSIADRKRTTHCAACGAQGHWQGDPECPASSTSRKGSNKGSNGKGSAYRPKPDDKFTQQKPAKSVHFMSHHYYEDDDEHADHVQHTSHQVLVTKSINEVLLTDATKAAGYVILDTACQRMCVPDSNGVKLITTS